MEITIVIIVSVAFIVFIAYKARTRKKTQAGGTGGGEDEKPLDPNSIANKR